MCFSIIANISCIHFHLNYTHEIVAVNLPHVLYHNEDNSRAIWDTDLYCDKFFHAPQVMRTLMLSLHMQTVTFAVGTTDHQVVQVT